MAGLLEKIFGTHSSHELKKIYPIADQVMALEDEYRALSEEQLRGKTAEFKERYQNGESLDKLLPEAFATMREAADRVLGMRHYRVQIIGGIVLHQGRIAEMKTGEGKTLMATLLKISQCTDGQGCAHCNGERLSGKARLRMDGQGLSLFGTVHRSCHSCSTAAGPSGNVSGGYHLRNQQRVWLRLSA